jgi:hypothetical protein
MRGGLAVCEQQVVLLGVVKAITPAEVGVMVSS